MGGHSLTNAGQYGNAKNEERMDSLVPSLIVKILKPSKSNTTSSAFFGHVCDVPTYVQNGEVSIIMTWWSDWPCDTTWFFYCDIYLSIYLSFFFPSFNRPQTKMICSDSPKLNSLLFHTYKQNFARFSTLLSASIIHSVSY